MGPINKEPKTAPRAASTFVQSKKWFGGTNYRDRPTDRAANRDGKIDSVFDRRRQGAALSPQSCRPPPPRDAVAPQFSTDTKKGRDTYYVGALARSPDRPAPNITSVTAIAPTARPPQEPGGGLGPVAQGIHRCALAAAAGAAAAAVPPSAGTSFQCQSFSQSAASSAAAFGHCSRCPPRSIDDFVTEIATRTLDPARCTGE